MRLVALQELAARALGDLVMLSRAMSQVVGGPGVAGRGDWRRCLRFFLDGLRAEAARPSG